MSFYSAARLTTTGSGAVNFSQISLDASTLRVGFVPSEDSLSLFNQLADADDNKVDIKTHYSSVNWDSGVTGYRLSAPYFVNYYNGTDTKFLAITDIISAYGETMLLFPDAIQNWINEGKQISNYAGVAPTSGWDVVPSTATSQEATFSITYGVLGLYDGSGRFYFSTRPLDTSIPAFQERIGFVVSDAGLFNYLADSDPNKVDLKTVHTFTWSPYGTFTGYRLSTPVYVNYFNGTETKLLACTDITNQWGSTCFLFPDAFDNWVNDGKALSQGYSVPSDGFDVVPSGATFEITSAPAVASGLQFSTTHNSGCTLTNNNTTAQTNTTNFRRAVSSNSASSGKLSFEFTIDQISEGIFLGITSEENPSSSNVFIGASNNSYGIYGQPTLSYIWEYDPTAPTGNQNFDVQFRLGDTVAFTFDADNGTLNYSVNGGTVHQITDIASGTYYPVIGSGSASKKVTATISQGQDITAPVEEPTPTTTTTVIDTGSGYTSPGADVPTTGGSGTGLKVSYDVGDDGGVKDPTVTDDGTGYEDGDVVDIPGGTEPAKLVVTTYTAPPAGTNTNSVLFKVGRTIKTAESLSLSAISGASISEIDGGTF